MTLVVSIDTVFEHLHYILTFEKSKHQTSKAVPVAAEKGRIEMWTNCVKGKSENDKYGTEMRGDEEQTIRDTARGRVVCVYVEE